jgi:hypothetical protein
MNQAMLGLTAGGMNPWELDGEHGIWARCSCRSTMRVFDSWENYLFYDMECRGIYMCSECGMETKMVSLTHGYYSIGAVVVWNSERVR